MAIRRRQFLQQTLGATAFASLAGTAPKLLTQAAFAAEGSDNDRVLVVLQLSGGNDGLNTVVPFHDDEYYKQRPTLGLPATRVLKISDDLGLHPSLEGLASQFEAGRLAIVQGVGYDRPNRSHFESMDIWHSCRRKTEPRPTGWLGRTLDKLGAQQGDVPGLHLGKGKQPFALASEKIPSPSIGDLEEFQLKGADSEVLKLVRSGLKPQQEADPLLSFIQSNTQSALDASQRVREAAQGYDAKAEYPDSALGAQLKTVAQLIDAGLRTKVYYVELDGFDTHSQQEGAHNSLMRKWSSALDAFLRDLDGQGHLDRVAVLTFSEFGRRVQENASEGTDHGAAAPVFLAGGQVQGGILGDHPSLTDLVQGDLKFSTDFRRVYATLLEHWLETPSDPLLYAHYDTLPLLKRS